MLTGEIKSIGRSVGALGESQLIPGPPGPRGPRGDNVELQYNEGAETLQWKPTEAEEWNELMSLAQLQGPIIAATIEETANYATAAENSSGAAANSAEEAAEFAREAFNSKQTALSAEDNARDHAEDVEYHYNIILGMTNTAVDAKSDAVFAAGQAEGYRDSAAESATAAETARQSAANSASAAENYSSHPPVVSEATGNWMEWDGSKYVETEFPSRGVVGPPGPQGDDYVLTDTDKEEIASSAAALVAFVQPDEPANAPDNSLWVDTDAEALYIARAEGVGF